MRARDAVGFSLVELLVVLAIMGLLASVALPIADLASRRDKEAQLRTALREIRTALDLYKRAGDEGRIARVAGSPGFPPNLDMLVLGVPNARSPQSERIYFLRRIPADPFYEGPRVESGLRSTPALAGAATWGLRSYASPAHEPKPGDDVFDVYSLSDGTGLDGRRYREW